jgi:hypothetical protein
MKIANAAEVLLKLIKLLFIGVIYEKVFDSIVDKIRTGDTLN